MLRLKTPPRVKTNAEESRSCYAACYAAASPTYANMCYDRSDSESAWARARTDHGQPECRTLDAVLRFQVVAPGPQGLSKPLPVPVTRSCSGCNLNHNLNWATGRARGVSWCDSVGLGGWLPVPVGPRAGPCADSLRVRPDDRDRDQLPCPHGSTVTVTSL